ncbi:hypothetical protein THIOM_001640 [Candidatus Thiomargarita nelsonii]|uniref:Uncharacterized protein n=1 Tax=Candidatus Thiomargarita nelsonii TaxID=1003181 RepID=A0A176S3T4_9GAMM|nr:hypothetical protein THIOM_001640 [Candidatus Thiomargarita nelsonii]
MFFSLFKYIRIFFWFPLWRVGTRKNLRRARRRLRHIQADYKQGKIPLREVSQSIRSWVAHLEHGDTWRLRQKIFESLIF